MIGERPSFLKRTDVPETAQRGRPEGHEKMSPEELRKHRVGGQAAHEKAKEKSYSFEVNWKTVRAQPEYKNGWSFKYFKERFLGKSDEFLALLRHDAAVEIAKAEGKGADAEAVRKIEESLKSDRTRSGISGLLKVRPDQYAFFEMGNKFAQSNAFNVKRALNELNSHPGEEGRKKVGVLTKLNNRYPIEKGKVNEFIDKFLASPAFKNARGTEKELSFYELEEALIEYIADEKGWSNQLRKDALTALKDENEFIEESIKRIRAGWRDKEISISAQPTNSEIKELIELQRMKGGAEGKALFDAERIERIVADTQKSLGDKLDVQMLKHPKKPNEKYEDYFNKLKQNFRLTDEQAIMFASVAAGKTIEHATAAAAELIKTQKKGLLGISAESDEKFYERIRGEAEAMDIGRGIINAAIQADLRGKEAKKTKQHEADMDKLVRSYDPRKESYEVFSQRISETARRGYGISTNMINAKLEANRGTSEAARMKYLEQTQKVREREFDRLFDAQVKGIASSKFYIKSKPFVKDPAKQGITLQHYVMDQLTEFKKSNPVFGDFIKKAEGNPEKVFGQFVYELNKQEEGKQNSFTSAKAYFEKSKGLDAEEIEGFLGKLDNALGAAAMEKYLKPEERPPVAVGAPAVVVAPNLAERKEDAALRVKNAALAKIFTAFGQDNVVFESGEERHTFPSEQKQMVIAYIGNNINDIYKDFKKSDYYRDAADMKTMEANFHRYFAQKIADECFKTNLGFDALNQELWALYALGVMNGEIKIQA